MNSSSDQASARPKWWWAWICVGLLLCVFVLCSALKAIEPSQHGNFLAFLGSLTLLLPAIRQIRANLTFARAAEANPVDPGLRSIKALIRDAQVQNFVRFSLFDPIAYIVGAALLAAGFLFQAFGWHIPGV